ncbi:MAG: hypothetical protein A3K77_00490 [Euryarchaeota archaeon RBG_13_31_8]|nr:MAG: hypothetical protein A3K77_00490 [Euryarchaeota archaeon RBG_13_31_8]
MIGYEIVNLTDKQWFMKKAEVSAFFHISIDKINKFDVTEFLDLSIAREEINTNFEIKLIDIISFPHVDKSTREKILKQHSKNYLLTVIDDDIQHKNKINNITKRHHRHVKLVNQEWPKAKE